MHIQTEGPVQPAGLLPDGALHVLAIFAQGLLTLKLPLTTVGHLLCHLLVILKVSFANSVDPLFATLFACMQK